MTVTGSQAEIRVPMANQAVWIRVRTGARDHTVIVQSTFVYLLRGILLQLAAAIGPSLEIISPPPVSTQKDERLITVYIQGPSNMTLNAWSAIRLTAHTFSASHHPVLREENVRVN